MYTTLMEWLNQNSHRRFPLDDSASTISTTGQFSVPTSFMVDMLLNVPDIEGVSYYVSRMVVRSQTVDVHVSACNTSTAERITEVGYFRVLTDSAINSEFELSVSEQTDEALLDMNIITGTLCVGTCADVTAFPGDWSFTPAAGLIMEGCVSRGMAGVRALRLGSDTLTGVVTLAEGSGIAITQPSPGVVRIALTDSSISVDDVWRYMLSTYGSPVLSINGVQPDSSGAFNFYGLDCSLVQPGQASVTFSNPCAKPCADPDKYQEAIQTTINDINARFDQLNSFYTAMSAAVNEMQQKLGVLQATIQG